jgi:hypothetical protein
MEGREREGREREGRGKGDGLCGPTMLYYTLLYRM